MTQADHPRSILVSAPYAGGRAAQMGLSVEPRPPSRHIGDLGIVARPAHAPAAVLVEPGSSRLSPRGDRPQAVRFVGAILCERTAGRGAIRFEPRCIVTHS